jgi:hypothetical protein
MATRLVAYMPALAAALCVVLATLNPNKVLAAGDCIEQPDSRPAQGGHWYYHSDRVNNRKCWYLVEPGPIGPQAATPESQPSPAATISQQDQSLLKPDAEQVNERPAPPLDQAKRDALSSFEEWPLALEDDGLAANVVPERTVRRSKCVEPASLLRSA